MRQDVRKRRLAHRRGTPNLTWSTKAENAAITSDALTVSTDDRVLWSGLITTAVLKTRGIRMANWTSPSERILWARTLSDDVTLEQRVSVASKTGFGHVSFGPEEVDAYLNNSNALRSILARAADCNVAIDFLECVTEWYPHVTPKRDFLPSNYSVDEMAHICQALGASNILALCAFPPVNPDEELSHYFGSLCDRMLDAGVEVHLEFTPMSPVRDLRSAWRIVGPSNRSNGRILFDTWHFFRGGLDLSAFGEVPVECIAAIQFSDAATEVVRNLINDTYHHRRLLGDGDIDFIPLLEYLTQPNGPTLIGPEIISDFTHGLEAEEAARITSSNLTAFLTSHVSMKSSRG